MPNETYRHRSEGSQFHFHDPSFIQDEVHKVEPESSGIDQQQLPDVNWPWASVDVLGSPRLSNLFEALSIHHPSTVEPLSLKSSDQETHPFNESNMISLAELDNSSFGTVARRSNQIDVSISPGSWRDPNPFNEVYPFPRYLGRTMDYSMKPLPYVQSSGSIAGLNDVVLRNRVDGLKALLKTLEGMLAPSNPTVLQTMEDLAIAYNALGKSKIAESFFRGVYMALERSGDVRSERAVAAMIQVGKFVHNKIIFLVRALRVGS